MRLIHRHASREKRLILFFLSFPLPMLARWSPLAFDVSTLVFTLFPPPSLPAHLIMPLTAQRIFSKTGLQSPDAQAEDPSGATLGVRTDQRTQRGRRLKVWLKKGQERQWVRKSRRRWSETLDSLHPSPSPHLFHQERGGGKGIALPFGECAFVLFFSWKALRLMNAK